MIGILSPLNPSIFKEWISNVDPDNIVSINPTATSVNNIVAALLKSGEHICAFTLDFQSNNVTLYEGDMLKIYVIGCKGSNLFERLFPNLSYLARLISPYIEKELPNLSVLHAQWCYEYAMAAMPYSQKIPVYCTIRDWAPVIYKNMTINGKLIRALQKIYWIYKTIVFNKVISNKNIHFVANSEYTKDLFLKRKPNSKVELIYNSIEDDFILQEKLQDSQSDAPILISIAGDLDENRKNIKTLIDAFALVIRKYPQSELHLIGHYRSKSGIFLYAKNLGLLNNVRFLGPLPRKQIVECIDYSNILVHPAFEETFGNTLIEGMARKIPVIGGENSGAVPFVLENATCGFLCDISDAKSIYEAILKCWEDKEYTQNITRNATLKIINCFSNTSIAQKHIDLYYSK